MNVNTEYGLQWIDNDDVYKNMTQDKCYAYCKMCAECRLDFSPCVGIEKCTKDKSEVERLKEVTEGYSNGQQKRKRYDYTKTFLKTCNELIDIINEYDFKWYPTTIELQKLGYKDAKTVNNHKYRKYVCEETGLMSKVRYHKLHDIKLIRGTRGGRKSTKPSNYR